MKTSEVNPIKGEVSYPVKIIFQVKNEGMSKLEIFAIEVNMFGAESGRLSSTFKGVKDNQELISLGPGEAKSFEFDHASYALLPYADRAEIRLFFNSNDYIKGQIDPSNIFVFMWWENDIRGKDY